MPFGRFQHWEKVRCAQIIQLIMADNGTNTNVVVTKLVVIEYIRMYVRLLLI